MSARPRMTFVVAMLETAVPQLVPRGVYSAGELEPAQAETVTAPPAPAAPAPAKRGRHRRAGRG